MGRKEASDALALQMKLVEINAANPEAPLYGIVNLINSAVPAASAV